jgi:spore germination cell wall hydrolase CwlJ-like protein
MKSSHNLIKLLITVMMIFAIYFGYNNSDRPKVTTEVQQEEEPVVAKTVDPKQLQCLATNLYFEAGGEPTEGIAAVARVVMNRIQHGFGSNPCQVIYQSNLVKQINEETEETFWVKVCQFSWVCEGKRNPNTNSARYQKSLQIAYDVLAYDKYKDVVPLRTLFFHNTSVNNPFPHEVTARIGNHIFYAKKKVKKHEKRQHRYKPTEAHVHTREVSGET